MSIWLVVGIIVLVLGIIFSNVLLLKSTANSKFSSKLTDANQQRKNGFEDKDEEDDWPKR